MIAFQPRRSLVYEVWVRLSAITVAFTMLALGVYIWLEIGDTIDATYDESAVRADVIATAAARIRDSQSQPIESELAMAQALGVKGLQLLSANGDPIAGFGDLVASVVSIEDGTSPRGPVVDNGYEVELTDHGYRRTAIGALDVLFGGEYGSVHEYAVAGVAGDVGALRVVMGYHNLSSDARVLLLRSLALTGFILAVAVIALRLLLLRFVAAPLHAYSSAALRIAVGENERMPDVGDNELGRLGQAINGMAEALRYQAMVDPLTGLYNLRHLTPWLESLLEESSQHGRRFALIACDIDNLKPVNDSYGHLVGDMLLKSVASRMQLWAGLEYTCWRTGGDEFAAVIPGADRLTAARLADALEWSINSASVALDGESLTISVSIGVACYPEDGTTVFALLDKADRRMYESKARKDKPDLQISAA